MANDTVPLGYLAAVADLDEAAQYDWVMLFLLPCTMVWIPQSRPGYWFYEYCGVSYPIVKEEVKYLIYPRLRAWEMGNKKRLLELTDENATMRRHLDSVDDQLHVHGQQLRRGHDVQVVPLSPGGGARMRQRRSGPRSKGGSNSRSGLSQ
ncbi:hypothetical protein GIB67_018337 [Kingdonia uniflora]|uniref:Uncharacterized protein n=1 Tax=Kingdonia uniflora TaxID=39325 RepID=A0A7J7MJC3_9MAGN|nr:hypothetical protein GIB67_018337 [Kingdonia uniflora]